MRLSLMIVATLVAGALCVPVAGAASKAVPRTAPEIVGGTDADIADWPSIGFLLSGWDSDANGTIDAFAGCTGTVIAPRWIVTAAHCAFQPDGTGIDAMVTITGAQDIEDPATEVIPVDRLVVNPGYDTGTLQGDALLVHLKANSTRPSMPLVTVAGLDAGQYVSPLGVPNAAGWGNTREDNGPTGRTNILQEAYLEIQDDDAICQPFYANFAAAVPFTGTYDPGTQTCAGSPGTAGACHGDSGGPLVIFNEATGAPALWGLTSFGPQEAFGDLPCQLNAPAFFTWVPGFATFIANTINPRPSPPPPSPPPPPPPPPADTTAPSITAVKLSASKFKAAKRGAMFAKAGAKLSFELSEAAAVSVTVEKKKGRKFKALSGSDLLGVPAGRTVRRFNGRLAGKALKPGIYRLRLAAVDTAGNRAVPKKAGFKIVR